ncbi:MAG: Cullin-3 [Watsoniomyces obsoletus]|nr:MAG: Cullin-3 [Watsoniomyces obsoletus]
MSTLKVIVVGSVDGRVSDIFKNLTVLHVKNNFSFALISGDLFADPSKTSPEQEDDIRGLLQGSITVPLTTYFSVGRHSLPARVIEKLKSSDGELCENLYYLGNRSVLKTSGGIKIVALGGLLDNNIIAEHSKDRYAPFFTPTDPKSLQSANEADILLTSIWPSSIRKGSKISVPDGSTEPPCSDLVSELCAKLRPRYHLSSSGFFYEREPFFLPNPAEGDLATRQITRFISLAPFGNMQKEKSIYAFTIGTKSGPPTNIPPGTTSSPFVSAVKRPGQDQHYSRFAMNDHRPSKRSRRLPPGPEDCFFCLANPNVVTHLIASIGNDCYLTAARGPLPASTTYPQLRGSTHLLIIPLSHCPRLIDIPEPAVRSSTMAEMHRYRRALQSMVDRESKGKLGAVTWEVNRQQGIHAHWQFLPVSNEMIEKSLVEAAFRVEAENERYPAFEAVTEEEDLADERDSFKLWISGRGLLSSDDERSKTDKNQEKRLLLPLPIDMRFDLQFGRRVMAKLLVLQDRINWKECLQDETEETQDVEKFKLAFHDFDFSLDDSEAK